MPALVCDICGGRLKIGEGKTAICESCGVEHSLERMKQKYREAKGVLHVDNAHLTENYYSLAKDAYDSGNKNEAERYCNKIIEINPDDFEAQFLKGKAVGWQSSLETMRFKEATLCFANAINSLQGESDVKEANENVQAELRSLATSLISNRCDLFAESPTSANASGFKNNLQEISSAIDIYEQSTGLTLDRNRVFEGVSPVVHLCMSLVFLTTLIEYKATSSSRAYSRYVTKADNCIEIMQKTIDLCDDDDEEDIELYQQIIAFQESILENNTTDSVMNRWGAYEKKPRLSGEEVQKRQHAIEVARHKTEQRKGR